ncbi:hypothetical protein M407DRAFT_31056 [Tulasnella calospora MUT 4182]|uniref:Ubiquitin-like protease family profile domain-containing protein n=1 Tax=Tulasnella calospora MUT 4182 TaxID=1051891 RepID=A0A0C3Q6A2_9AGAM|nr:hypothetical protein M407DRAFT_31056 [Tulasnella calospora MUT 4182]
MPAAQKPDDPLRRHAALYTRLTLSGTIWEFEVLESNVEQLKKGIVQGAPLVNYHLASIYNRYTEIFPGSPPEVVLLPANTYASWKKKSQDRPDTGLPPSTDLGNACHVVFPFYWEAQGRWLLVVLAYINSLLLRDNTTGTAVKSNDFTILVLDALDAKTKPPYHMLAGGFCRFTKALLLPRLDLDHQAIAVAKPIPQAAPVLSAKDCQAAQPGHYLGLLLAGPSEFIDKCKLGKVTEVDWDLRGRAEVLNRLAAFMVTHSSIAMTNLRWKQANPTNLRAGTAAADGRKTVDWDGEFA